MCPVRGFKSETKQFRVTRDSVVRCASAVFSRARSPRVLVEPTHPPLGLGRLGAEQDPDALRVVKLIREQADSRRG